MQKLQAPPLLQHQSQSGIGRRFSRRLRMIRQLSLVFSIIGLNVIGIGLTLNHAMAESPGAPIALQRTSSAPSSWLDPLRDSAKPRTAVVSSGAADREQADAEFEEADFDLSEFSDEPDRTHTSHISGVRASITPDDEEGLREPADSLSFSASELEARPSTTEFTNRPLTPESVFSEYPSHQQQDLCWQILPKGLLYKTYLAGEKEPRMQFLSMYDTKNKRKVWDAVLGGRVGILRNGSSTNPQADAFQRDLEGAVFARVLPDEPSSMLEGSDYRVGLYGTWRSGRTSYRAGYYHISSHVGDEYLLANPGFNRINYVRDSLLAGVSYELTDVSRIYTELGYALGVEGGAKPFELQLGTEHTPRAQTPATGAPFFAVNGHWRQDFGTSTAVNIVSGWGWQGVETKRRLRLGLNCYNGPSLQYEFFDRWENLVGAGIWLDY